MKICTCAASEQTAPSSLHRWSRHTQHAHATNEHGGASTSELRCHCCLTVCWLCTHSATAATSATVRMNSIISEEVGCEESTGSAALLRDAFRDAVGFRFAVQREVAASRSFKANSDEQHAEGDRQGAVAEWVHVTIAARRFEHASEWLLPARSLACCCTCRWLLGSTPYTSHSTCSVWQLIPLLHRLCCA